MATTAYATGNALTVKLWAKKLFVEAVKTTRYEQFKGSTSTDSLISLRTEMQKSAGDKVTIGLRMQLTGTGATGDSILEGNEEALLTYSDSVVIDQLRHAVRSAGKMSEQRVAFTVRDEAKAGLRDWWSDRIDGSLFNQLAGATVQQTQANAVQGTNIDNRFSGMQAAIAPTAQTNQINCDTSVTNHPPYDTTEASLCLTTTYSLKLADIDRAVAKAKTATPVFRPLNVDGNDRWVLFIHPYQTLQLRANTSSGQWNDINKFALGGTGKIADNPLISGMLGIYNNTYLVEDARVPCTTTAITSSTSYRRSIFCGAQAASIAFGGYSNGLSMDWNEETFDYGNQLGVEAGLIWGLKKMVFNSADFATIVLSAYAPAA